MGAQHVTRPGAWRGMDAESVQRALRDGFDTRAALYLLRHLFRSEIGAFTALQDEADAAMGTAWFNTRFPTCPLYFSSVYTPKLTSDGLLHLAENNAVFTALRAQPEPHCVLFGSAKDGLPLLAAHTLAKAEPAAGNFRFAWYSDAGSCPVIYVQTVTSLLDWMLTRWTPCAA